MEGIVPPAKKCCVIQSSGPCTCTGINWEQMINWRSATRNRVSAPRRAKLDGPEAANAEAVGVAAQRQPLAHPQQAPAFE